MSDLGSSKTLSNSGSKSSVADIQPTPDWYLKLSKPIALFEGDGDGKQRNASHMVFFDHVINQLFVVRSHGLTGVTVFSGTPSTAGGNGLHYPQSHFKISSPYFGEIRSITQSPDGKCLTIVRTAHSNQVEFLLEKGDHFEYAFYQTCKAKNSKMWSFYWVGNTQLLIITNISIEFYNVNISKKSCKLVKSMAMCVSMAIFHVLPTSSSVPWSSSSVRGSSSKLSQLGSPSTSSSSEFQALLVIATTDQKYVLNPFIFKAGSSSGSVTKLPKFEVDMPMSPTNPGQKMELSQSDMHLLNLYDETYISVIRKQPVLPYANKMSSELVLYRVSREAPAKKTYVLRLAGCGKYVVNVVDNLIVVHHQEEKVSLIFDIKITGGADSSDGYTHYLNPLLTPPGAVAKPDTVFRPHSGESYDVMPYKDWIVFRPDLIINTHIGAMWRLTLDLNKMVPKFTSNAALLRFLQLRWNSRQLQLDLFKKFFLEKSVTLKETASLFDILNEAYRMFHDADPTNRFSSSSSSQSSSGSGSGGLLVNSLGIRAFTFHDNSVIKQLDMLTIFEDLLDQPVGSSDKSRFIVAVIIEYIRSLEKLSFRVDYRIENALVSHLVVTEQYYQLHQLLQFLVITDTQYMACKLLSLHESYPAAIQLAIDMFHRLGEKSNAEIFGLLLSRKEVITAIKFARIKRLVDDLNKPEQFLEVARSTGDRNLFYSTYKFFQEFNFPQSNQRSPLSEPICEKYTKHFEELFGRSSLEQHRETVYVNIANQLNVI